MPGALALELLIQQDRAGTRNLHCKTKCNLTIENCFKDSEAR